MKRYLVAFIALTFVALLGGCATTSSDMVRAAPSPEPAPGKALVVFLRPSRYGGAIQSSIYDTNSSSAFIGIVSAGTGVTYQADPGTHLFMVVGENADFMNASLDPGKTYFVLVSPRMGMWKARFSLLPIHNDASAKYSIQSPAFAKWQNATTFVEKTPAADAWYQAHAADIAAKQAAYMQKWNAQSAEQKAELTLHPGDGVSD